MRFVQLVNLFCYCDCQNKNILVKLLAVSIHEIGQLCVQTTYYIGCAFKSSAISSVIVSSWQRLTSYATTSITTAGVISSQTRLPEQRTVWDWWSCIFISQQTNKQNQQINQQGESKQWRLRSLTFYLLCLHCCSGLQHVGNCSCYWSWRRWPHIYKQTTAIVDNLPYMDTTKHSHLYCPVNWWSALRLNSSLSSWIR